MTAVGAPTGRRDWSVIALLVNVFAFSCGMAIQVTVLGKQVYDLTGRELDLGLLGLAEFAPVAVLVLVTGSVADRFDRRRVALLAHVGQAVSAGGLLWYTATSPTAVGPIFGLVLLFGVFRAFSAPTTRALPADVVAPARLPWLTARRAVMWQTATIVGPVTGGIVYAVDERLPYLLVMALMLVAAATMTIVHVRPVGTTAMVDEPIVTVGLAASDPELEHGTPGRRGTSLHEAMAGLRFIRHHPILLGAISLDLFAVLFGGAVALLPAIAEERLGVGSVGLGWLRAAGGIGAALATLSLAVHPLHRRVGRAMLAAVAVFGVATMALGLTRTYLVAFLAMAVLSAADAVSVFVRSTLVPLVTPTNRRGRVLAVENVFIGASNELGAFESGVAGQLLGPAGAVVLGGAATIGIAVSWSALFPDLRDVDRFPGMDPDDDSEVVTL